MTKIYSFRHDGLGNSSYLVELAGGKGFVIDPDRRAERYLESARAAAIEIVAVLETHLHADFVAGARELAAATDAELYLPRDGDYQFPFRGLVGGDVLTVAGATVEVVATPGHSLEHLSFVLRDGAAPAAFTGGSLLAGGAARTDLSGPDLSDSLTRSQFQTLASAFSHLPDETLIYPTHGGGSFCSVGAGQGEASTLGTERATNRWLALSESEFVTQFPASFPMAPRYFSHLREFNRIGPPLRADLPIPDGLAPEQFRQAMVGATVVDIRPVAEYSAGHIPGVLSNALRPQFSTWLGSLVPFGSKLLFVGEPAAVQTALEESRLVGYDNVAGYLAGGMEAWVAEGQPVGVVGLTTPRTVADATLAETVIIDVRQEEEYHAGHVPGALNLPLGLLEAETSVIPAGVEVLVYCAHGERSSSGASLLKRAGFHRVTNVLGGFTAWREAGLPVEGGSAVPANRTPSPSSV